ncbi:MAG: TauD/TfdA family dioxygenase [Oculatellaceae cyanobacterium Prado106]|jgi:alpha-ketoglutarate-dependent taurine dioxygenase|nr:TauD/TfdA family dioxygenase [Oculatellaceae cyanobacterium Prado106]
MNIPMIDIADADSAQPGAIATLKDLAIALCQALQNYPHYVVVNGFPPHHSPEYLKTLARGIGAAMEVPPTKALLDEEAVSFTVVNINPEAAEPRGDVTRFSRTRQPLNPHTDSSYLPLPHELVGFQCIVADDQGGETVMVPVEDVLLHLDADVAALLREPVYSFGALGEERYAILSGEGDAAQIRYYRAQIDYTLTRQPNSLSEAHQAALQKLDVCLEQLAPGHQFVVQPGQIVWMHNHQVLHGRTALSSKSDRLLYRIRLHVSSLQLPSPTLPNQAAAHLAFADHLEYLERWERALEHYQRASAATDDVEVLNRCGHFLLRRGWFEEAIALFQRAIALEPNHYDNGLALSSLAHKLGNRQEAQERLEHVIRCHPHILEDSYEPHKPTILRLRGFEGAAYGIVTQPDGTYEKILRGGHFSTDHLLNKSAYNIRLLNLYQNNVDELETLPAFDLILNTIACPDSKPASLRSAARFVDRHPHIPCINSPQQVLETTRERNSIRLNRLSGVRFPHTQQLWWDGVSPDQVVKQVMDGGFTFPVIVREVGSQTGQSVVLLGDSAALRRHFENSSPNQSYYVIQFHNCCLQPDVFHKMRLFCIDGVFYPVANVFHDSWNIHSGDRYSIMIHHSWMQDEEKAYLSDPVRYLGRQTFDHLSAIRDLVQLDFFGLDFTLLQDGTLLIFELNAAMRHNFDHAGNFPYTRPYLEKISHAFHQMVRDQILKVEPTGGRKRAIALAEPQG